MALHVGGMDILLNNNYNKGLGFSLHERKLYNLHGLLPTAFLEIKQQSKLFLENLREKSSDLDKYCYLMELYSKNVKLFFYTVMNNVTELLPYIYTPTVGTACLKFGRIYNNPSGLFISIDDAKNIELILGRWPHKNVKAICVTDGERILGLGDLGIHGMGIPIGKLALYTALGGVNPTECLPITLDVGTNNQTLLNDEFYLGQKIKRIADDRYEKFIDEFMRACTKVFGSDVLIQHEDFGNHNAFALLQRYRSRYCMFNDDIQGTAAVVLTGIINATNLLERRVSENTFLFYGAGEAALGTASLLIMLMEEDNIKEEDGRKKIFMFDSKGLIVENRPKGGLTPYKSLFAQKMEPIDSLIDAVNKIRPTIIIGASAQPGAFTTEILTTMANINSKPVIMSLSNPTSKSECTALEAYTHTKGTALFASGSPFDPVNIGGRNYVTGQANNSYIFPGVALAVINAKIHPLHDKMFLAAAKGLAREVKSSELKQGCLFPHLSRIHEVSLRVAESVCEYAYRYELAHHWPKPKVIMEFLKENFYKPQYDNLLPEDLTVSPNL